MTKAHLHLVDMVTQRKRALTQARRNASAKRRKAGKRRIMVEIDEQRFARALLRSTRWSGCSVNRMGITPRLAVLSPVYACGKTTLLILLEANAL
jgi:hypothetical protein